jgi:hypothetical protein
MQVELRRRLSQGFLMNASYTFSRSFGSSLQTLRRERIYLENADVPHSFKLSWLYELPVGRERRFGSGMNRWLKGVLGNWQFSGTGRLQKNQYAITNTRLVGMSESELQDAFSIRHQSGANGSITVFSFPEDIVTNTRLAYNTSPTAATGYSSEGVPSGRYLAPASVPGCVALYAGDCGSPTEITLNGPLFTRFDMCLNKRFPFGRKASVEFTAEVLNVFDNINYNHVFTQPTATSHLDNLYRVTTAYTDINTTFDPGGRIGHLMWRINF